MHHPRTKTARIAASRSAVNPLALALTIALGGGAHAATASSNPPQSPATDLPHIGETVRALTRPDGSILRFVENCNDAGVGSLRNVAAASLPGDGIDLTMLTCSEISVRTGTITLRDVSLAGPGRDKLKINGLGNNNKRIFNHASAGGALEIDGLTISGGKYLSNAGEGGGCLRSNGGRVTVRNSTFANCMVVTPVGTNGNARGGAIAAYGNDGVTLLNTTISSNTARTDHGIAAGGGVFALQKIDLLESRITNNAVSASGSGASLSGGGLQANGGLFARDSTIDGNTCDGRGGGGVAGTGSTLERVTVFSNHAIGGGSGLAFVGGGSYPTVIHTSTISGNISAAFDIDRSGALYANSPAISITNSTITNNHETTLRPTGEGRGAGITFGPSVASATLRGTIVSGNCFDTVENTCFASDIHAPPSLLISGNRNLIAWSNRPLPADTIMDSLIRLGPLQDNGGATWTHLPAPNSPAIDNGDPDAVGIDQRGFPRVAGAAADIGSVEANDVIFRNGFD